MESSNKDNNKKQLTNFAKYTGIAFQMLATIGVFAFIGYQIDKGRGSSKMIFTAILGVIGVVVSLVSVIKSLSNTNK